MNPRIKAGWDYFWNLKPSTVSKWTNQKLLAQFHAWQQLMIEEMKTETPTTEDLMACIKREGLII